MDLVGYKYHVVGGYDKRDIDEMMGDAGAVESGLRDAQIVLFAGGTDISPSIYNEFIIHPKTQQSDRERDKYEVAVFHACQPKLKVGICRGAQLLCALSGGKLFQHVDGHHYPHSLIYIEKSGNHRSVKVTSDHHQMMQWDENGPGELWGKAGQSNTRETSRSKQIFQGGRHLMDTEILWFRGTRSLCFQPHPEWPGKQCRDLFFDCVRRAMKEVI